MLGRIPGLVRFATDPKIYKELLRLRKLAGNRIEQHVQPQANGSMFRFVWRSFSMQKIARHDGAYLVNSFLPPFPSRAFETLVFRNLQAVEYGEPKRLVVPPLSTNVAITNACPLHCWHCSRARRPGQCDLSVERWLRVLSELQDWGVCIIGFTGGEPLVHPELERMISSVDGRSTTYIFTSGIGLDARRARSLKETGLFGAIVSLDHYQEAEHDRMRGFPGAYRAAISALREARQAGLYTMLELVATKKLLREDGLNRMFELAMEMHTPEVRILPPIPTGALLDAGSDVLLTSDERQQIADIDSRTNNRNGYPKVSSYIRFEGPDLFGCGAGSQHSYIDAAGNVYPCDFVPLSFGNVTERSFRDIWCEVSTAMGHPRRRCFMLDNGEAVREAASGQLPLSPEASHSVCQQCQPLEPPDYYKWWHQMWQHGGRTHER